VSEFDPDEFGDAFAAILEVLSQGHQKHGASWRSRGELDDLFAAQRHLGRYGDVDEESGMPHAAHVAARMVLHLSRCIRPEEDDGLGATN